MHKRVSSGERHTSSGDNNARKIIAPSIIIYRSMVNASSRPTACRPLSKKLRSVPTRYYLDCLVSVTGYCCAGVSKLLGSITTPALILPYNHKLTLR